MIEYLLDAIARNLSELTTFLQTTYDPVRDTIDILIVSAGIYWLLVLIRGTRAVQVLMGLGALVGLRLFADFFELQTSSWIFDNFFGSLVIIIVILFADDIRRALARVGRGFVPRLSERQESAILEEVVRASQTLAQRRVGALIVLERESDLRDHIASGTQLDSTVSKELLTALFMPTSPLHDGAVLLQQGRIGYAGCILPLTQRTDLPEGVGTRHRAAVGISEQTDAVVVVVSEETGSISVVMGGEMTRGLDAPELRVVLRDYLSRGPGEEEAEEEEAPAEPAEAAEVSEPVGSPR